jgi:hypothetical protein
MELMSEELRKKLPPLYSQENKKDPIVYASFSCQIQAGHGMS